MGSVFGDSDGGDSIDLCDLDMEDDLEQAEVLALLVPSYNSNGDIIRPEPLQPTLKLLRENVVQWQEQFRVIEDEYGERVPLPPSSNTGTSITVSSAASTVRGFSGTRGGWLASRPRPIVEE